ncbi:hypothetical protein AAG570_003000, partial [Ranatra chinensis]
IGSNYVFELENDVHKSSCTETYYQCNLQSTRSNMLLELFEQLGYIVFSGIRRSNGVQGLRLIVQSDRHPVYIDQRVEIFLSSMRDYLNDLQDDEFERHKEALAAHRLEKPKQLYARTRMFWSEITTQQYNFDRANIEVACLRTIKKEDILKFYDELISKNAPHRHKLAVHVLSTSEGGAGHVQEDNGNDVGISSEDEPVEKVRYFSSMFNSKIVQK